MQESISYLAGSELPCVIVDVARAADPADLEAHVRKLDGKYQKAAQREQLRKVLGLQRDGAGFTFVELLSPCPTIWKIRPQESRKWIEERMLAVFPLGVYHERKLAPLADAGLRQV